MEPFCALARYKWLVVTEGNNEIAAKLESKYLFTWSYDGRNRKQCVDHRMYN